jgi:hypothetical protein
MAREGLLVENCLHLRTQLVKAAPHVRHACSNPDLRASAQTDHGSRLSNTTRNRTTFARSPP